MNDVSCDHCMRGIVGALPFAVSLVAGGKLTLANRRFASFFGMSHDAVAGFTLDGLLPGFGLGGLAALSCRTGKTWAVERVHSVKGRNISVLAVLSPLSTVAGA